MPSKVGRIAAVVAVSAVVAYIICVDVLDLRAAKDEGRREGEALARAALAEQAGDAGAAPRPADSPGRR